MDEEQVEEKVDEEATEAGTNSAADATPTATATTATDKAATLVWGTTQAVGFNWGASKGVVPVALSRDGNVVAGGLPQNAVVCKFEWKKPPFPGSGRTALLYGTASCDLTPQSRSEWKLAGMDIIKPH